jgi:3-hydroxyisobutyrate dehydrogenase
MRKGAVLVDHTTSKPNLAAHIYKECFKSGVKSVDAPVSGGDVGAREGTNKSNSRQTGDHVRWITVSI